MFNYIIYYLLEMDMPKNKEERKSKRQKNIETWAIAFGLIFMFGFWLKYPQFIEYINKERTPIAAPYKPGAQFEMANDPQKTYMQRIGDNYGTYGDSYGSLNTLFSGLAFAALFISLLLQRRELEAQRKELNAQREETKESNKIAEAQRKITQQQAILIEQQIIDSKIQAFYQLLFKHIEEKNRKINNLTASNITGQNLINYFCNMFEMDFTYARNPEYINTTNIENLNNHIYECLKSAHLHTANQLILNEYTEYLIFILRFIENNKNLNITENAIVTFISYQNIIEIKCMAYLAIENEELFALIHKYALLRKLNTFEDENNFIQLLVKRLYKEEAFSPR